MLSQRDVLNAISEELERGGEIEKCLPKFRFRVFLFFIVRITSLACSMPLLNFLWAIYRTGPLNLSKLLSGAPGPRPLKYTYGVGPL